MEKNRLSLFLVGFLIEILVGVLLTSIYVTLIGLWSGFFGFLGIAMIVFVPIAFEAGSIAAYRGIKKSFKFIGISTVIILLGFGTCTGILSF